MSSKTYLSGDSTLARTLPAAEFTEWHCGVIDADIEAVWDAVHCVKWSDLRFSKPALLVRGFGLGPGLNVGCLDTFAPHAVVVEHEPTEVVFIMIGRPWSPVPQGVDVAGLDQVRDFAEPGWLKYGMEWLLTPLPNGRTLLETRTLCEPTDSGARRRFAAYWLLIRPWSGLIRREMITAIGRLSTSARIAAVNRAGAQI